MYEITEDCMYGKKGDIVSFPYYNNACYEDRKKYFRPFVTNTPNQQDASGFREGYNYESISYPNPYTSADDPTPSSWGEEADTSSDSGAMGED